MSLIKSEALNPIVAGRFVSFAEEILRGHGDGIHSFYVVGSSITPDFEEKTSDINSLIVFKDMDLGFLEFIAPLGKKYRKKGIAAPLIMTPAYIESSLDVFPIEFFDLKNIHITIYGEDLLQGLRIDNRNLRFQCEREIKSKLISLRQGYLSCLGDKKSLASHLVNTISGYVPLFRAIINLMGNVPPVEKHKVAIALRGITGLETDIFEKIILVRKKALTMSIEEIVSAFRQYYAATERLSGIVDELRT